MVNVIFNGRLGADAEIRQNKNGVNYVTFNVAVHEFRDGEDKTTWLRVYGREERFIKLAPHLKKGSLVSVNGKEHVSTFVDKNGNTQISREVTAFSVNFISVKNDSNDNNKATTTTVTTPTQAVTPVVNSQMEMSCGTLQPQMVSASSAPSDYDDLPF